MSAAAKVTNLGDVVFSDEDVFWLEVSMNYLLAMRMGESIGYIFAKPDFIFFGEVMGLEVILEGASLAILHDDVILFIVNNVAVVEPGDIGMRQYFQIGHLPDDLPEVPGGLFVELLDGQFLSLGCFDFEHDPICLLYTSPSPRDQRGSRMPSSA